MSRLARTKPSIWNCPAIWQTYSTAPSSPPSSPFQPSSTVSSSRVSRSGAYLSLPAPSRRILSLKDPKSKMSKSSPDIQSRILLTDSTTQIRAKIRGAVTDSTAGITFDPVLRPGISNLVTVLAACGEEPAEEVARRYESKGHGEFKTDVADAVEEVIKGPRAELEKIRHESAYLAQVAEEGADKARERSRVTIRRVRELVGLR